MSHPIDQRHHPASASLRMPVCKFWLAGRCTRYQCPYLHDQNPPCASNRNSSDKGISWRRSHAQKNPNVGRCKKQLHNVNNGPSKPTNELDHKDSFCSPSSDGGIPWRRSYVWKNPNVDPCKQQLHENTGGPSNQMFELDHKDSVCSPTPEEHCPPSLHSSGESSKLTNEVNLIQQEHEEAVCSPSKEHCPPLIHSLVMHDMINKASLITDDHVATKEKCNDLNPWFEYLIDLQGHAKGIVGIALPAGSDKLYTGSRDGIVRVWNCNTGQCIMMVDMEDEIICMFNKGPWVFAGVLKAVKAWNTETGLQISLEGSASRVNALAFQNELLFAGLEYGIILVWKSNTEGNNFEPAAVLTGHRQAVVSLIVGVRLYSGSVDETIRVWDLETLECIHTLEGHTSTITSVLCWNDYLLSCSLDCTIKVWAATNTGSMELIYTHNLEHGVLAMEGIYDANEKPVIMCSLDDHSVQMFELPSFGGRGTIFYKSNVRSLHIGPSGLFFTGDEMGAVKVWRYLTNVSPSD
ncbi:zinc finger CCCH domain-containing protein 17-like [Musa acuminata AAA Group]|uniref:zinc finger CCCH domain-containing protein 17-like n=1 Tax=Musa acuminata AAA Group TaxID=214697 RepID=UPI0031E2AF05